jgi:Protein of unknown function (DUF1559)
MYRLCFLCSLLFLTPLTSLSAQTAFDPAARAAAIAPLLDDQTIAIGRVDLDRLDAAAIVKLLADVIPPDDKNAAGQLAKLEQAIKGVKTALRAGGISQLYAVLSLHHLPKEPVFVVAPLPAGTDAKQAADILKEITRLPASDVIGGAAVAGTPEVLDRLKTLKPSPRPDLTKAFALAGDTTAQLIVAPTDDTRRVIREMLPKLPKQIGGGSGEVRANGLRWVVLSVNAPPKLSLNLTVQAKDETAAAALQGMVLNAIQTHLAQMAELEERLNPRQRAGLEAAVRLLTPQLKGDQLVISHVQDDADVKTLLAALIPAVQSVRTAAGQAQSTNNLKQLGIAMHAYHDMHGHFAAQAIRSKEGKPLLSWRVALLPYLGQNELYDQFKLNEPWDSDHNKRLIEKLPPGLASPHLGEALIAKGMTSYVVPLTKAPPAVSLVKPDDPTKPITSGKNEMVFDLPQGTTISRILDGTSNTIMVLEVHPKSAVIWTKPEDLVIDERDPLAALTGQPGDAFLAALCDGSVRTIKTSVDRATFWNLLRMNDLNPVGEF